MTKRDTTVQILATTIGALEASDSFISPALLHAKTSGRLAGTCGRAEALSFLQFESILSQFRSEGLWEWQAVPIGFRLTKRGRDLVASLSGKR